MRILSLETATHFGGVGWLGPDGEESIGPFAPRESSSEVLAGVAAMLERHNCHPDDLDLIAVSTGPGLFTGVRIGLSIAKTLAWAQGSREINVVAVPTLDAVAALADRAVPGDSILALTDARRGEVYSAWYRAAAENLERMGPDLVIRPDRLTDHYSALRTGSERIWIVGDALDRYHDAIRTQFHENALFCDWRVGSLSLEVARLGKKVFKSDGATPIDALQPHYVRRPDARLPVRPAFLPTEAEPTD